MRKIAIANQKGGVGKTVTAINLSYALSGRGKKVLLIDTDPQAHATIGLGIDPLELKCTTYDFLTSGVEISEALVQINGNLYIVAANIGLSSIETKFLNKKGRQNLLVNKLFSIEEAWDYIIIDSPPSLGLLTVNALRACSELIIPIDPSYFALQGVRQLIEIIRVFEREVEQKIDFKFLLTMFEKRTNVCQYILDELKKNYGNRVYPVIINKNVTVRESIGAGVPLLEYDPRCQGSLDYLALAEEVNGKEKVSA